MWSLSRQTRQPRRAIRGRGPRGQIAVETAIVMPLFLFIILGLLQLGLMHQAHLMTKYASYKATRAGSLSRGDKEVMRHAALAVLLPMTTGEGRDPLVSNVNGPSRYLSAYNRVVVNRDGRDNGVDIAHITICNPTSRDVGPTSTSTTRTSVGDESNQPSWGKFMHSARRAGDVLLPAGHTLRERRALVGGARARKREHVARAAARSAGPSTPTWLTNKGSKTWPRGASTFCLSARTIRCACFRTSRAAN